MGDEPNEPYELTISDELKGFAEETLKQLQDATAAGQADGWRCEGEEKGVNIFVKKRGVTNKFLGRSVDWEPHSAHKYFLEITLNPLNRRVYDKDAKPQLIARNGPYSIARFRYDFPALCGSLSFDLVVLVVAQEPKEAGQDYFVAARSIVPEHFGLPEVPEEEGVTRADMRIAGWRITPNKALKNCCSLAYLVDIDPRINVSVALLDQVKRAQPLAIAALREHMSYWDEPQTLPKYVQGRVWCAKIKRELSHLLATAKEPAVPLEQKEECWYYYPNAGEAGEFKDAIVMTSLRMMRIRQDEEKNTAVQQVEFEFLLRVEPFQSLGWFDFNYIPVTFSRDGQVETDRFEVWNNEAAEFFRTQLARAICLVQYDRKYPGHASPQPEALLYAKMLRGLLKPSDLEEKMCNETELAQLLPLLLCSSEATKDHQGLIEVLAARCKSSQSLYARTMCLLHAAHPESTSKLFQGDLANSLEKLLQLEPLAPCIESSIKWLSESAERKLEVGVEEDVSAVRIVNPLAPQEELRKVKVMQVFNSSSKPVLLRADGEELILKPDPVVKDCMAMCALSVFNSMWKQEGKPYRAITYQILPVAQYGVLEYLKDVESVEVWDAESKWNNITQLEMADREKFIQTAVGGFVAAFMLGVRDRHKDNMLVVKRQEFAMIDFEYLFNIGLMVDAPSFALSGPMARCISDMGNMYWSTFEESCCDAFAVLRRNQDLVVKLLSQLFVDSNLYSAQAVELWVSSVFLSSESDLRHLLYKWDLLWAVKDFTHTLHAKVR